MFGDQPDAILRALYARAVYMTVPTHLEGEALQAYSDALDNLTAHGSRAFNAMRDVLNTVERFAFECWTPFGGED